MKKTILLLLFILVMSCSRSSNLYSETTICYHNNLSWSMSSKLRKLIALHKFNIYDKSISSARDLKIVSSNKNIISGKDIIHFLIKKKGKVIIIISNIGDNKSRILVSLFNNEKSSVQLYDRIVSDILNSKNAKVVGQLGKVYSYAC